MVPIISMKRTLTEKVNRTFVKWLPIFHAQVGLFLVTTTLRNDPLKTREHKYIPCLKEFPFTKKEGRS